MKNSMQLKDLIRNMAREKGINAQILMRNYMLERLLERIALSEFKDKFVLKGGMLVAVMSSFIKTNILNYQDKKLLLLW